MPGPLQLSMMLNTLHAYIISSPATNYSSISIVSKDYLMVLQPIVSILKTLTSLPSSTSPVLTLPLPTSKPTMTVLRCHCHTPFPPSLVSPNIIKIIAAECQHLPLLPTPSHSFQSRPLWCHHFHLLHLLTQRRLKKQWQKNELLEHHMDILWPLVGRWWILTILSNSYWWVHRGRATKLKSENRWWQCEGNSRKNQVYEAHSEE